MESALGLYLHIPFCKKKCSYCDFNSYSGLEELIPAYLEALCSEMRRYLPCKQVVHSVYFGGGTPSLVPATELGRVLEFIKSHFNLLSGAEITTEINPGTVGQKDLDQLLKSGFNRISIGGQAVQDHLLEKIGRIHRSKDIFQVMKFAQQAGFSNISLDLMFGLPGQSIEEWRQTLERVIPWEPQHLSTYGLQVEEGTLLAQQIAGGQQELPSEDETVAMMALVMDYLPSQKYVHYEISNYARPGYECRHNLSYWKGESYLGFGAGATSTRDGKRWTNLAAPIDYIEGIKANRSVVGFCEQIDGRTALLETLMLGLRLRSGLNIGQIGKAFNVDLEGHFKEELIWLTRENLLKLDGAQLYLTEKGLFLANQVIGTLINKL